MLTDAMPSLPNKRPDLRLELRPCPLCGGLDFEVLATQDRYLFGLHTAGCRSCGLLQTNPRPDEQQLTEFYALHYRSFYQGVTDPDARYVANLHKVQRLRYTTDFLKHALKLTPGSRLLDYGCGEGSLFVALRESGFTGSLYGVELNEQFGRFAAEQGRAAVGPRLAAFDGLDAVVINHVLEHLPEPLRVLAEIRGTLAPEGLIYVDVPDALEYTGINDLHIAHIMHFTETTLGRMLEQAGFEIVSSERHAPPHHPRSIRVVARVAIGEAQEAQCTTALTEMQAWARMQVIARTAWRWTLRRRIASVSVLRVPYRRIRSILQRGIPKD